METKLLPLPRGFGAHLRSAWRDGERELLLPVPAGMREPRRLSATPMRSSARCCRLLPGAGIRAEQQLDASPVPTDHNQWGHLPLPIRPLSPHSTCRLARQADTRLAHRRALDVEELIALVGADQATSEPQLALVPPVYDWEAATKARRTP